MIKIGRKVTTDDIEELYVQLSNSKNVIDLTIPDYIESNDIGITSFIIQFVSTWIRRDNSGKLYIAIKDTEDAYEDFIKEPYAFPSIIMAWNNGIFNSKTNQNLKPLLKKLNVGIRDTMQSLQTLKGQKLLLTCFDHLSREKGLLNIFYDDNSFINSDATLEFLLYPSIQQVIALSKTVTQKNIQPGIIDDLIVIIYELMKNTDDWARTDEHNQLLNPNVRGLYINFLRRKRTAFNERYYQHDGLSDYFNSIEPNDQDEIYLLELSVFDSGIGFIRKRIGNSVSDALTQVNVVKECLIKNMTSARGLERDSKGLGLDRILRTLNQTGFLWIRTGNVSLYRNLKKDEYFETQNIADVRLYDWATHQSDNFTRHELCEGTSISIIYPINYR